MSDCKLIDNSKKVLEEIDEKIKRGLEVCGAKAEGYAKQDTPVDTGRLKNSISHKVNGYSAYIGTNVEYAKYVELGTSRQKANHMLRNAVQNHVDEYKKTIEASLKS